MRQCRLWLVPWSHWRHLAWPLYWQGSSCVFSSLTIFEIFTYFVINNTFPFNLRRKFSLLINTNRPLNWATLWATAPCDYLQCLIFGNVFHIKLLSFDRKIVILWKSSFFLCFWFCHLILTFSSQFLSNQQCSCDQTLQIRSIILLEVFDQFLKA